MPKFTRGRTVAAALAAALAIGGTWAIASHGDSSSVAPKQEQRALTPAEQAAAREQAMRDADAKSARLVAENQANAQEANEGHAERFCAGEIGAPWLDIPGVLTEARKLCPDVVKKGLAVTKKRDAAEQAAKDEPESDSGLTPPGNMNIDGYCNSRYDIALRGNTASSPYFDYSDKDIVLAEREFNAYCADYDIDESPYY